MTDRDAILRALAKELDPLPSDADAVEAAPIPPKRGRGRPRKNPMANSGEAGGRREVREILTDLVKTCDLWHARDGGKFATFTAVDGTTHHVRVRAAAFADWLIARAYEATGGAPGRQQVEDALRLAEAMASLGAEQEPWMRVGARDGALFIDLVDDRRAYIEITANGWSVREDGGAPFIRTPAMRPLPEPYADDPAEVSIDALRPFVNVASTDDFILTVSWLLAALRPSGPFPILSVGGQQGTGKSTFSRLLRGLVDPSSAPIRAAPREVRDAIVGALNCHAQVFDNLSSVSGELSDALCRLATGGGASFRQLHTDRDELIFDGQRPILLNGIPQLCERPDLADRAIAIRLVPMDAGKRRTEAEFWADFDAAAPAILVALCNALSAGLRNLSTTRLENPPRLADFATWATACEAGLGWAPGTFLGAFEANRRDVSDATFEADQVAVAIRDLIRDRHPRGWTGTATALLSALADIVPEEVRRSKLWPMSAQGLGNRIERVAPLLKGKGLVIERRHSGERFVSIMPTEDFR